MQPGAKEAAPVNAEADKEFWIAIKDSQDPDELGLYLEQFPSGAFVALARKRIAKLREKKA